jgi:Cu-Zn family superoxide dismutase
MRAICIGIGLVVVSFAIGIAQVPANQAKAELKDASGKTIGTATVTEAAHGVVVRVILQSAPEGPHAFHIHQTGKCEAPFTTAGAHFNPASKQHGIVNPMGMHAGDLPNVQVPAGGRLTFEIFAPDVALGTGSNSLLDADGSALVLHQGMDDYKSDPAGNAGERIACGIVTR